MRMNCMAADDGPKPTPGWYPDVRNPLMERWWTGRDWSVYTRPAVTSPMTSTQSAGQVRGSAGRTKSIPIGQIVRPAQPISVSHLAPPVPTRRRRLSRSEGVAILAVALLLLIGLPGGVGGVLIMLGLGGLVVGVYA